MGVSSMKSGERALACILAGNWDMGKMGTFLFQIQKEEGRWTGTICLKRINWRRLCNSMKCCMGSTMIWLWQSKTHATYINMAACLIKLKRYDEAIGHCNIVRLIIPFIGRINHFLKI
ncbi:unnamed protein product [Brassica rapa]|uniref:Uncharacterized protein n=1 Tax=Brassica campestris TaxID=3711 RepID=A0A8D9GJ15_BRACM|nr:unnamed protein product [Brassica rapa]